MLRFAEVGKICLPDKYVEKLNFNTLETVNVEKGQDNYTAISLVEGHMH